MFDMLGLVLMLQAIHDEGFYLLHPLPITKRDAKTWERQTEEEKPAGISLKRLS